MARLCERPGCSDRADVAYGFDAQHLVVWLDVLRVAEPARSGVLCRRHANAMVVPIGWMLDDRREPEPRLFPAPTPVPDADPVRRRRTTRPQLAEQLQFDVAPVAAGGGSAGTSLAEADGTPADGEVCRPPEADRHDEQADHDIAPWMPQFDQSDDLQGLLNARGRLLSRAFNGRPTAAD